MRNNKSEISSAIFPKCYFCNDEYAVVTVKGLSSKSFCLLHYYTTRACRNDPSKVVFIGGDTSTYFKRQLPESQMMFFEAFNQLRKEISDETAKASSVLLSDPLSILNQISGLQPVESSSTASIRRLKQKPVIKPNRPNQNNIIIKRKRQQAYEASRIATMSQIEENPYKRRKPTKTSFWTIATQSSSTTSKKVNNKEITKKI